MKGNYEEDKFTENDVLMELDRAGLKYFNKGRYLLSQCPMHDDKHPSVQIYKDDWFVNCHAGCGRFHITKAFPSLRENQQQPVYSERGRSNNSIRREQKVTEHKYKQFDLMADWEKMELLPEFHLHGVPSDVLNDMGWRKHNHSVFIPYFSASKGSIPFAQYRHLQGDVRFTMLKDAKPTMYGTWNLDNDKLFLVEGTSDAAVLEYCAVPWIAAPSAASGELVKAFAMYCKENGIQVVYAGDNDTAGDKLREALDEILPYRVKQVPTKYKDWGEFLEATDVETVQDYAFEELFGKKLPASIPSEVSSNWPGAEEIKMADPFESKEPAKVQPQLLF